MRKGWYVLDENGVEVAVEMEVTEDKDCLEAMTPTGMPWESVSSMTESFVGDGEEARERCNGLLGWEEVCSAF